MESGSRDWRALFHAVQNETDTEKLKKKVEDLEAAVFFRFQENPDPAEAEELTKAVESLLKIKVEKLGYPIDSSLLPPGGRR
jgi:hypothetical protein